MVYVHQKSVVSFVYHSGIDYFSVDQTSYTLDVL